MMHSTAVVVALLLLAAAAPAAESQTYRQILTTRPSPRLEDLAERSAPDRSGDLAIESFWDLLKLRDAPNAAAVPALIKIVEAHGGTSRIHRFAAGQALLTAGIPDGLKALERDALRSDYPADLAVMYTSHWEMAEPARSQLLERYILRSTGDRALGVTVAAAWENREGKRILAVTVTLTNRSAKPLAVLLDSDAAARGLHFRSASGEFGTTVPQRPCIGGPSRWVRLVAGASEGMEVALTPTRDAETLSRFGAAPPAVVLYQGGGAAFGLSGAGRHRLYMMVIQTPMTEAQVTAVRKSMKDAGDPSELWVGRAISEPAEVEIGAPDPEPR